MSKPIRKKKQSKNPDIYCTLNTSQALCWALRPVWSLLSSHSDAGIIFIIPILQMWTPKSGEVKVTSLWSPREETVEVGFEPRSSRSRLFARVLDPTVESWQHDLSSSKALLCPPLGLQGRNRPFAASNQRAHLLSHQPPWLH